MTKHFFITNREGLLKGQQVMKNCTDSVDTRMTTDAPGSPLGWGVECAPSKIIAMMDKWIHQGTLRGKCPTTQHTARQKDINLQGQFLMHYYGHEYATTGNATRILGDSRPYPRDNTGDWWSTCRIILMYYDNSTLTEVKKSIVLGHLFANTH